MENNEEKVEYLNKTNNSGHKYMSKELARYLTYLIANDCDRNTEGCISSYECELLEEHFKKNKFEEIENYLRRKLLED